MVAKLFSWRICLSPKRHGKIELLLRLPKTMANQPIQSFFEVGDKQFETREQAQAYLASLYVDTDYRVGDKVFETLEQAQAYRDALGAYESVMEWLRTSSMAALNNAAHREQLYQWLVRDPDGWMLILNEAAKIRAAMDAGVESLNNSVEFVLDAHHVLFELVLTGNKFGAGHVIACHAQFHAVETGVHGRYSAVNA